MAFFVMCGILIIVIILITSYIVSLHDYWRARNIPYLVKYPLLMSKQLLCLQTSLASYLQQVYNCSKDKLVGFHILGQPGILLRDPELIKQILVKDFSNFSGRTLPANLENDPIGGRVLFKLYNPEWKLLRSHMSPFFSTGSLKNMSRKMAEVSSNFVEYLTNHQREVMHVKDLCSKFSVDVISGCGFSFNGNCFKDEHSKSMQAAKNIFVFNFYRGIQFSCHFIAPLLVKLFRMTFLEPSYIAYVQKMFEEIKEYRSTHKVNDNDFADTLLKILEEKKYSTPEEVVAQAAQIWMAGFETVSSTTMYALYELARNKPIQQKLRMEINTAMNNNDNKLNYDCINNVEYLEMFLCETLRLYPSVPFADRKASNNYRIPETDMVITKGTNIYVSILGLHYDPELFPEPSLFDPERFSKRNKQFIKPNSYLPFGKGPRDCLGFRFGKLSVKYAIAHLVSNFAVEPVPYPGVKFDNRGFVLAPEEPIKLNFTKLSA